MRNNVCEFIGTFAFTLIGGGAIVTTAWSGEPGLVGIALAHGVVLSIVVTATMNLSGGHINPAVTIAMLFTGRIKPGPAVGYIISQVAGATVAGVLLSVIFGSLGAGASGATGSEAITACALGTPAFNADQISAGMALLVEILLTFVLIFAIFGTAVDQRAPGIAGFGIGLAVAVDILMGGPLTGAAMNPARTIGTLIGGGSDTSHLWKQHWVYWAGPVIGAVGGAFLYDALILKPKSIES